MTKFLTFAIKTSVKIILDLINFTVNSMSVFKKPCILAYIFTNIA